MFTDSAQRVIDLAKDYAFSSGSMRLNPSSLLAAMGRHPATRGLLAECLGLNVDQLQAACPTGPEPATCPGHLPLDEAVRTLLARARELAREIPDRQHPSLFNPAHLVAAYATSTTFCTLLGTVPRSQDNVAAWLLNQQEQAAQTPRLGELSDRLQGLRNQLLARVFGQDHAIHAFVEGLFNSELGAVADQARKAPRAVFAFAGPPGVGKTLLAELGAACLERPFKRFDMSAYADHQQFQALVGWARSYQAAHPGQLTEFVQQNPDAILLFDEIEKAHLNTLHLFLQILDAGRLEDKFHERDVPFRDTTVIFTTNAGRRLYEAPNASGVHSANAAFHRQTILDALANEKDPRTGQPFFPAALCSRLGKGYPVLFNLLGVPDLVRVVQAELRRVADLLERQYYIQVVFDPTVALCLMLREGARADARTLCAQAERFIKGELFQFCQLFKTERLDEVLERVETVRFGLDESVVADPVLDPLFQPEIRPCVLLVTSSINAETYQMLFPELDWRPAESVEDIGRVLATSEPDLALVDPWLEQTIPSFQGGTMMDFDHIPVGARRLERSQELLRTLHVRQPELPVFLLAEPLDGAAVDAEVTDAERFAACVRGGGARGVLTSPLGADLTAEGEMQRATFAAEVNQLARRFHQEKMATRLGQQRQVLGFDTVPRVEREGRTIAVRLRHPQLSRALAAADAGEVLDAVERPQARFADVIGADSAKEELQFFIDYLKEPGRYLAAGLKPPKGVLLYGPPGTGKTLLARAMAGESEVAFLTAAASAFVTIWQGSGPQSVRDLFARARRYAPAIVFIDEIDAIGRVRAGGASGRAEENTLNALLTEMDGFTSSDPRRPVFVLAATNFNIQADDADAPERSARTLDPALVRRFSRAIRVDLPDTAARRRYLEWRLGKTKGSAVSVTALELLAEKTVGMSLADLDMALETAARLALRQNRPVDDELLIEAIDTAREGEAKPWSPQFLESTACHEAGHTLMYWLSGWWPVEVSIVARAEHGGGMRRGEVELRRESLSRADLLATIRTALGGRAAEVVYYGPEAGLTTGAASDLEYATRLARQLICRYGMDDEFGPLAAPELLQFAAAVGSPLYVQVSEAARTLLKRELERTVQALTANRSHLDAVAEALIARNRLLRLDLEVILPPVATGL